MLHRITPRSRRSATLLIAVSLLAVLAACGRDATTAPSALISRTASAPQSESSLPPTVVYGPATFTRSTGKPRTDVALFDANAGDTITYILTSASSQGLNASVEVNGSTLFSTSGGHGLPDTVTAVARATNSIHVTLAGKPGSSITIIATVPTPPAPIPGLVLYYPLNGDATDASPSGMNGVVTNGEWVPDRGGNPSAAFHVPTNNSWVVTPFSAGSPISFPTSSQFSTAMWVRADSITTGLESLIFTTGLIDFGWAFGVRPSGTIFAEVCTPTDYCHSTEENAGDVANTPLAAGQWVHIALAYDGGAGRLTLYLNGQRVGYSNVSLSAHTTDTEVWFGTAPFATQYWFPGAIDEIRVYNRLLTSGELSALSTY